ncbi:hypothetical protein SAMN05444279_13919 [Ruegeria intermedia]|uniref:Uncharacterized protein n=1 Tax=Ruegeria intermedia TaxID=996115 RepID=A0A1M5BGJ4_9RHOB|nr:hypothetical protein SAMN05444279_13919 [Ruegeria intermedia]
MGGAGITGVDLAWNVFQVHGSAVDGSVVMRERLSGPCFAASRD